MSYFETIQTCLDALLPENSDVEFAAYALPAKIPEDDLERICSKLKEESGDEKHVS
ncbi:hypothetical protein ACVS9P_08815 [Caproicibacterium sp. NSD3]